MSLLDLYREAYEYEKDCNQKMLAMLESVPEAGRHDARFQQAVSLAGHLAACRENWLDRMDGEGLRQTAWLDEMCVLDTLRPRFAALEGQWTDYLTRLEEGRLAQDFEYPFQGGRRSRLPTKVQMFQLTGHACYHRGQVALLVDQLEGETVDTDYLYWFVSASAGA